MTSRKRAQAGNRVFATIVKQVEIKVDPEVML